MRYAVTAVLAAACVTAVGATATAEPRAGAPLPPFEVNDLEGARRRSAELGRRPTLVVAIADPDAGDAMRRWVETATERYRGGQVHVVAVCALRLPMFATEGLVRSRARAQTPRERWRDTWIDRRGRLQRALGLPRDDEQPYVWVLGRDGRVAVSVHGPMTDANARRVFSALP